MLVIVGIMNSIRDKHMIDKRTVA